MKLLLEHWRQYLNENKEVIMFPARHLKSHMGEYSTEPRWKEFFKKSAEEQKAWAKTVNFEDPVEITVFLDGVFGHGDGHHRVMAGKILDIDIPITISYNHMKRKGEPGTWEMWWKIISQGNDPKEINPEGYNLRTVDDIKYLIGRNNK